MMELSSAQKKQWFKSAKAFLKKTGFRSRNNYNGWNAYAVELGRLTGAEVDYNISKDCARDTAIKALNKLRGPGYKPSKTTRPVKASFGSSPQGALEDKARQFYKGYPWRNLRYKTLLAYGRRCMCCGATDKIIHVDHIKPLKKYWDLRLDPKNLQVLCEECNHGKASWSEEDFRPSNWPELLKHGLNGR